MLVLLLGLASFVSGCAGEDDGPVATDGAEPVSTAAFPGGDVPVVVATTSIWGDIATNVSCGAADVVTLVPAGGDPHSYEPSLRDRETLDGAALVVANGLGLEAALDDTLDSIDDGDVFRATEQVPLLGDDPHVWADPALIATDVVPAIAESMRTAGLDLDPSCAEDYTAELLRVDGEVDTILEVVPPERRRLVTSHDSLAYFAARYGFEIIGAVIPGGSTLGEANPADLADLAAAISDTGVPAIFAEEQHSPADVEALAAEVGDVDVVTLHTDSLGPPDSDANTYTALLLSNARLIADALG